MMVPIVEAVLGEIKNENIKNQFGKKNNKNSQGDEVGSLTWIECPWNTDFRKRLVIYIFVHFLQVIAQSAC